MGWPPGRNGTECSWPRRAPRAAAGSSGERPCALETEALGPSRASRRRARTRRAAVRQAQLRACGLLAALH
eukprot:9239902-Lingulodinium_polyedra.AAC.1